MADIDAPHAGRAVDQTAALAVDDINAVAAFDRPTRLRADAARNRPGLDEMLFGKRGRIARTGLGRIC
ncbi:hypothetical protein D3C72_1448930 [compost metagenome]